MGYHGHFSIDGRVTWQDRWEHMTRTERWLFVIAGVNFFALIAASLWLGGDAVNGKSSMAAISSAIMAAITKSVRQFTTRTGCTLSAPS